MRISDWSSDVCSSDLRRGGVACSAALVGVPPKKRTWPSAASRCQDTVLRLFRSRLGLKACSAEDTRSSTIKTETVRGRTVRTSQLFQTALALDDHHSFFLDVRRTSERPGEPLSEADATAQSTPCARPAKLNLAQTPHRSQKHS